jgi:hypothetical protein
MLQLEESTKKQVDLGIETLTHEFAGRVEKEKVERIGAETLEELLAGARVSDFIPVFVYRYTRERLRQSTPAEPGSSDESCEP